MMTISSGISQLLTLNIINEQKMHIVIYLFILMTKCLKYRKNVAARRRQIYRADVSRLSTHVWTRDDVK